VTERNVSADGVQVVAQWALQGKTLGRGGYHVLACSTGDLNIDNFTEVITRFSMGTPESLPQVTISYLAPGPQGGVINYLALAIHQLASDAQPSGGQLVAYDDDGRPVVLTSYYCVPYEPAASQGVSYQAMYRAFEAVPLEPENGRGRTVRLAGPPGQPLARGALTVKDELAVKTAALLLTGQPVCVLGAKATMLTERLEFIDAVMALLPYGFRARMTAATWTIATSKNHRFKLFFSGAPRDASPPDHVVYWGRPDLTVLTEDDTYAYDYQQWLLREGVREVPRLARLAQPRSLGEKDVLSALDKIIGDRSTAGRHHRGTASKPDVKPSFEANPPPDPNKGTEPGPDAAAVKFAAEEYLLACAEHLEKRNLPQLSTAITQLKNSAGAASTPEQRQRYRELIKEFRLFRHDEALSSKYEGMLREALLKVAFVTRLGYEDYCLIEDAFGDGDLDQGLLQLIEKTGMSDLITKALVYRLLQSEEAAKKLGRLFSSRQLSLADFVDLPAHDLRRPQHMQVLCGVTIAYLTTMYKNLDAVEIDRALRRHSYLARKLEDSKAGPEQYQVEVLWWLLRFAYPKGLTERNVIHLMTQTTEPPTLPFLAAVLLTLADPAHSILARHLYTLRLLSKMKLEEKTDQALRKILWYSPPETDLPPEDAWPRDEGGASRAEQSEPHFTQLGEETRHIAINHVSGYPPGPPDR
jgi:hypothetical protein